VPGSQAHEERSGAAGRPNGLRHLLPLDDLAALQALSERGLAQAGHSLSRLLGHGVRLGTSGVAVAAMEGLPPLAAERPACRLAGLQFRISGEGRGCLFILFPRTTIVRMLQVLLGGVPAAGGFSELERSTIREIGNVVASSFLTELGDSVRRRFLPSPPRVLLDDLGRVMAETQAALRRAGSKVVVIEGTFSDPDQQIEGRFFILPEVDGAWQDD
jgi:chemotaxis protein CheC